MNRRWLNVMLLGLLMLTWGAVTGCQTLTQSAAQNAHMVDTNINIDTRELAADVDMVLLLDRNCRLTQWHIP